MMRRLESEIRAQSQRIGRWRRYYARTRPRPTTDRAKPPARPRFFCCLRLLNAFCYICKVLVGPGTPYLGHDVQTAMPLVARTTRESRPGSGTIEPGSATAGCIDSAH